MPLVPSHLSSGGSADRRNLPLLVTYSLSLTEVYRSIGSNCVQSSFDILPAPSFLNAFQFQHGRDDTAQ